MNLTKGKIAKLYSKKRQSKKKYNKKRYRKNRTLRKTRGFNLAKRTLKHVKRGGLKTVGEIEHEYGLCLSDCRTKHPDEDSKEYKDCTDLCDKNVEKQKAELHQLQQDLSMVPSVEEIYANEEEKLEKEMKTQLQIKKDRKLAEREQAGENTALLEEISQVTADEKLAQNLQQQEDARIATSMTKLAPTLSHPLQNVNEMPEQKRKTRSLEQVGSLGICQAKCSNSDVVDKDGCLRSCDEGQEAENLVAAQELQREQERLQQNTEDAILAQDLQEQEKLTEQQIINDAKIATLQQGELPTGDVSNRVLESQLDMANPHVDEDSGTPPQSEKPPGNTVSNRLLESQEDMLAYTPANDQVEGLKQQQTTDTVVPSPPPLSSTPPEQQHDKLSQAIDTIVDHLSTKIAEKINLPQGAITGTQNGFEAVNAAALTRGGRKPSRRLINRKRRNKSHKKKK